MGIFSSKQWSPKDIGDLTGKVVIVTGANTGMGYIVVEQLALHGAKVYMGARSESKAFAALEKLRSDHPELPQDRIAWLPLDLTTIGDVKRGAAHFLAIEDRLDILINNAARVESIFELNEDGIEKLVAVNHVGHFLLVQELLSILKATAAQPQSDVRIITVSSEAYKFISAIPKFDTVGDLNVTMTTSSDPGYVNGFKAGALRYSLSKLMNILFAKELQKRFDAEDVDIVSLSLHPGIVATDNAVKAWPWFISPLLRLIAKTALQGASIALFASVAPIIRDSSKAYKGAYLIPYGKVKIPAEAARDDQRAVHLWRITEEVLAGNS